MNTFWQIAAIVYIAIKIIQVMQHWWLFRQNGKNEAIRGYIVSVYRKLELWLDKQEAEE